VADAKNLQKRLAGGSSLDLFVSVLTLYFITIHILHITVMFSEPLIFIFLFQCVLKMTEEDVDADFHAEKITADIFERFDRDENNSLTKNEFQTAFFKQHKSFDKFPTLYSLTFSFQTE
jgi:hypothetical protein